ncbi:MAG: prolipoprotein diacylglyceryl transferase [Ilumatobacteraceae bacterium]
MLASIPSPPSNAIDLWVIELHAYGIMIAIGVIAAVWLAGRRLEAAGAGTREQMSSIGLWSVAAGIIGARAYYVITDPSDPWRRPGDWLKIWEGGLGVPGGLLLGIVTGAVMARRHSVPVGALLTAAAPAIPLAQAIGRWGNWFNQELFGRPTTLPWGLEIDYSRIPAIYRDIPGVLFHPTFLYESLWNLALCGTLIAIERRWTLRPGRLMALYVAGYAVGRFLVEDLRIDSARDTGGLRLNQWVSIVAFAGAMAVLLRDRLRTQPAAQP